MGGSVYRFIIFKCMCVCVKGEKWWCSARAFKATINNPAGVEMPPLLWECCSRVRETSNSCFMVIFTTRMPTRKKVVFILKLMTFFDVMSSPFVGLTEMEKRMKSWIGQMVGARATLIHLRRVFAWPPWQPGPPPFLPSFFFPAGSIVLSVSE